MKWMYRPSVTEMDRGGVYEMDRPTKCQKMEMRIKWIDFNKICWTGTRMFYCIISISVTFPFFALFLSIHFIDTSSIHFWDTWSVHLFHRHFLQQGYSRKSRMRSRISNISVGIRNCMRKNRFDHLELLTGKILARQEST